MSADHDLLRETEADLEKLRQELKNHMSNGNNEAIVLTQNKIWTREDQINYGRQMLGMPPILQSGFPDGLESSFGIQRGGVAAPVTEPSYRSSANENEFFERMNPPQTPQRPPNTGREAPARPQHQPTFPAQLQSQPKAPPATQTRAQPRNGPNMMSFRDIGGENATGPSGLASARPTASNSAPQTTGPGQSLGGSGNTNARAAALRAAEQRARASQTVTQPAPAKGQSAAHRKAAEALERNYAAEAAAASKTKEREAQAKTRAASKPAASKPAASKPVASKPATPTPTSDPPKPENLREARLRAAEARQRQTLPVAETQRDEAEGADEEKQSWNFSNLK